MNSFLLDLWHDLREKRLWPIAVLLLVATAAVPVVLLQKAQPAATPAPSATQAQPAADKLPTVTLDDVGNKVPSDLAAFKASQRNPFRPLKDLPKADKDENATVTRGKTNGGGTPPKTPTTGGTPTPPGAGSHVDSK